MPAQPCLRCLPAQWSLNSQPHIATANQVVRAEVCNLGMRSPSLRHSSGEPTMMLRRKGGADKGRMRPVLFKWAHVYMCTQVRAGLLTWNSHALQSPRYDS